MNHKKEFFTYDPLSSINRNNMTVRDKNDLESISKQAIKHTKPQVIVIGGSLGGLCVAIALRSVDCEVEIFEKSHVEMNSRGAGIVYKWR